MQQVVHDKRFVRIGRGNDGGYLMLDDFKGRKFAYSIGIADDVSWDKDMAERGLDIYMYDHTIEDIPYKMESFHFSPIGLGANFVPETPQLETLDQMMKKMIIRTSVA